MFISISPSFVYATFSLSPEATEQSIKEIVMVMDIS
jgi:hypothetical protein